MFNFSRRIEMNRHHPRILRRFTAVQHGSLADAGGLMADAGGLLANAGGLLADQHGSFQLALKNSKIIYFSGGSRRFSRITADGWRMPGDHGG